MCRSELPATPQARRPRPEIIRSDRSCRDSSNEANLKLGAQYRLNHSVRSYAACLLPNQRTGMIRWPATSVAAKPPAPPLPAPLPHPQPHASAALVAHVAQSTTIPAAEPTCSFPSCKTTARTCDHWLTRGLEWVTTADISHQLLQDDGRLLCCGCGLRYESFRRCEAQSVGADSPTWAGLGRPPTSALSAVNSLQASTAARPNVVRSHLRTSSAAQALISCAFPSCKMSSESNSHWMGVNLQWLTTSDLLGMPSGTLSRLLCEACGERFMAFRASSTAREEDASAGGGAL